MSFVDAHSHYNDEQFDLDRDNIIFSNKEDGLGIVICAGYDIESSKKALEIAYKYDNIYATVGISPNDVPESITEIESQIAKIEEILLEDKNRKIVAVGEIGLDYHWNQDNKEIQKEMFKKQIDLANKYNLPIQIHTREATIDTIQMIKNYPVKERGMFHCCPLNMELIKEALKLDYYISFAGPITFKNSKNAEEIVRMVPLNRIFTETDSPYLAPEPKRGTRNSPGNVIYITEKVAAFKELSIEEVEKQVNENFIELYGKKSKK